MSESLNISVGDTSILLLCVYGRHVYVLKSNLCKVK